MELNEVDKRLAAAVDAIDEAMDKFADNLNKKVVPRVKELIERLNEIDWDKLR